jgi:hypothetical protein
MVFVPNTCGLTLASYVVRKLIGGLWLWHWNTFQK